MFKKLRNKFLLLSMSFTSLVMIVSFTAIYLTTYNNIQNSNAEKLGKVSVPVIGIGSNTQSFPSGATANGGVTIQAIKGISADYTLSFSAVVDKDGKILNIHSFIDMPKENYEKAIETAWKNPQSKAAINLSGRLWQYAVTTTEKVIINKDNGVVLATDGSEEYKISFLDVTESRQTLRELLTTFLIVGFFTLAVIFAVSLYFASRAIRPIEEAWEKQRQFVADASHELKTPLTIINSNIGAMLVNKEESIESQMKWLDYIKAGTDRMTYLIHNLLDLAKLDGADDEVQTALFNLSKTVSDIVSSMESAADAKHVSLSLAIESGIHICSDEDKIRRVVFILLDNAIKYVNENGWIEVSLVHAKRHVTYTVKNSGKGIAKEDLPKVFDRFYRSDKSRTGENGSYGLGLPIAKTSVESLGGKITAESKENDFTVFTVILPANNVGLWQSLL